jgi:predicted small secreted protein
LLPAAVDRGVDVSANLTTKERSMKNKAILAVLLAIAALSAGCNTVSGAGKDIERGGEKIQGAADRNN